MLKLSIAALLAGLGMLVWLMASRLSSDAIGMALGVIFGVFAFVPALMVSAVARRREPEERIVYRERIVYLLAEPVDEPETRLADDWAWLADSLDSQAQVQLGVVQRQLPERRKVMP